MFSKEVNKQTSNPHVTECNTHHELRIPFLIFEWLKLFVCLLVLSFCRDTVCRQSYLLTNEFTTDCLKKIIKIYIKIDVLI